MPLLRNFSARLRRRRRLAADRARRDAARVQVAEHAAALERILDLAKSEAAGQ